MKIVVIAAALIVLSFASVFAADFKTPHRFKPGDVISSDVMNEVFDYIQATRKTLSALDLVGGWQCTKFKAYNEWEQVPAGYALSSGRLFISTNGLMLNITEDASGAIKWNSPLKNAFGPAFVALGTQLDECAGEGFIESIEGEVTVFASRCDGGTNVWPLDTAAKISDTRIKLKFGGANILVCDLKNVPPAKPTDLVIEGAENGIFLSWADNSADETGFKVVRKDSLNGNWAEIATVSANVTSYTDNVPASGSYWYRVRSYNSNGNSIGSNVVTITVE